METPLKQDNVSSHRMAACVEAASPRRRRSFLGSATQSMLELLNPRRRRRKSHDKILFLDVDGVLNTDFCVPRDAIHPKLLKRLADVVQHTGAEIVLSSTWRLHPVYRQKLINELKVVGVDCTIDNTPSLPLKLGPWPPAEAQRAAEIAEWLQKGKPRVWAAVDDLDLCLSDHADLFEGHFVRTLKESGLSETCANSLRSILGPSECSQPPPSTAAAK